MESSQRKCIGTVWELGMLPRRGLAVEGEMEITLTYTLIDAHRCGLAHEYRQPGTQPDALTDLGGWVAGCCQEPRVAAASLSGNTSPTSHRPGLGGV